MARIIGVTTGSVMNWEKGHAKIMHTMVGPVLDFLGYDPRPKPTAFHELVRWKREGKGLSQRALAALLGVDPSAVRDVEATARPGMYKRTKDIFARWVAG